MKQYKTIPAPTLLTNVKEKEIDSTIRSYASLIEKESKDGWEFVSMGSVQTSTPPGCLFALLGAKPTLIEHNMLIFERER